jgi:hypothetical protein
MFEAHQRYWNDFYADARSAAVPREPSAFARWTGDRIGSGRVIVEFGFGTARDALWFAGEGHPVRGYDFAETAVAHANEAAAGLDAQFGALDLGDSTATKALAAELDALPEHPLVYGRFLIHSLEDEGRHNLLVLARDAGAELYVEFRTGQDRGHEHLFGDDHYRTYLDPETVVAEIEGLDGRVTAVEQGHGLAVYKTEDPHVARIVADWVV